MQDFEISLKSLILYELKSPWRTMASVNRLPFFSVRRKSSPTNTQSTRVFLHIKRGLPLFHLPPELPYICFLGSLWWSILSSCPSLLSQMKETILGSLNKSCSCWFFRIYHLSPILMVSKTFRRVFRSHTGSAVLLFFVKAHVPYPYATVDLMIVL